MTCSREKGAWVSFLHARLAGVLILAAAMIPAAWSQLTPGDTGLAPFASGERLVYHVDWTPPLWLFFLPAMDAGEATLTLAGETQYKDKKALKIIFTARSSGALAKFVGKSIDDSYEFTTDPETFCTYCVSKREREGKRMRDIDIVYLHDTRQAHIREVDVSGSIPRVLRDKDYDGIPPCVKDLFSALYVLRKSDLAANSSRQVLIADNERVREVEIRVGKSERVHTPAGDYKAWQVNTVAVFGGLFKNGGQFRMWLSADDRKIPVKFEAKISLGKVTGNLIEARFTGNSATYHSVADHCYELLNQLVDLYRRSYL
jgi:hypothetical protein